MYATYHVLRIAYECPAQVVQGQMGPFGTVLRAERMYEQPRSARLVETTEKGLAKASLPEVRNVSDCARRLATQVQNHVRPTSLREMTSPAHAGKSTAHLAISEDSWFLLVPPSLTLLHLAAKFREHKVSVTLYDAGDTLTNINTFELPLSASCHKGGVPGDGARSGRRALSRGTRRAIVAIDACRITIGVLKHIFFGLVQLVARRTKP